MFTWTWLLLICAALCAQVEETVLHLGSKVSTPDGDGTISKSPNDQNNVAVDVNGKIKMYKLADISVADSGPGFKVGQAVRSNKNRELHGTVSKELYVKHDAHLVDVRTSDGKVQSFKIEDLDIGKWQRLQGATVLPIS